MWLGRVSTPLFSTSHYAKDIEALYQRIWKRYEQNLPTDHLTETCEEQ